MPCCAPGFLEQAGTPPTLPSIPVVGDSRQDRVGAVDLLQGEDEGHFVLERQGAERPQEIGGFSDVIGQAIGSADHDGARFPGMVFDFPDFAGQGAAGEEFALFVEDEAEAIAAPGEELFGFAWRGRGLDGFDLDGRKAPEPGEIILHPLARVGEAGFADGNDAPTQGGIRLAAAPD